MFYLVQVPLHHCSCWLTSLLRHDQSTQGVSQHQQTSQETARTPGSGAEQFWKTPCSSGSENTSSTMLVQKQETSLFLSSFLIKFLSPTWFCPNIGTEQAWNPRLSTWISLPAPQHPPVLLGFVLFYQLDFLPEFSNPAKPVNSTAGNSNLETQALIRKITEYSV